MAGFDRIAAILNRIYGRELGAPALQRILPLIEAFPVKSPSGRGFFQRKRYGVDYLW